MNVDRNAFNDTEWTLYQQDRCSYQTAYGLPWSEYCGKPLDHGNPWGYCPQHAKEVVDLYEWRP